MPSTPTVAPVETSVTFERIRQRTVELGLLRSEDWDKALAACGESENLLRLVKQLQRLDAPWTEPDGRRVPLLTEFQGRKIVEGKAEELRIGEYVVRDFLGSGGMGHVYKVRDAKNSRDAALKILKKLSAGFIDEGACGRFLREAKVLERLNHANYTTFYGSGSHNGAPFIVMEYLEGQTVDAMVKEGLPLGDHAPIPWSVEATAIIAEALAHAHANGIVHRDIKPANIMVTRDGRLKLLDLGIARLSDLQDDDSAKEMARLTQQGVGLGTPEYMAPEQWKDAANVTPATDVYSLGCTLFFMLTGSPPFRGSLTELMMAHMKSQPPSIRDIRPDVPRRLDAIMRKMLASSPAKRYRTATELKKALLSSGKQPFPWAITVLLLLAAALSGLAAWWFLLR